MSTPEGSGRPKSQPQSGNNSKNASFRNKKMPSELIDAAKSGDEKAMEGFMQTHQKYINAVAEVRSHALATPPAAHSPFTIPQDTYTLLHLASEGTEPGHTACVAMLLANGADPGAVDADGQSALHLATASGSLPTVRLLTKGDCPQLLLADKYQMTPFHLACESGYDDMVQYLLSMFRIDPEMRRGARAAAPPPHPTPTSLPVPADRPTATAVTAQARRCISRRRTTTRRW